MFRKQETLTGIKSETVNLGKEKKQTPKQQLKDAKITLLKKDEHGIIDVMFYLIKLSEFIIHYQFYLNIENYFLLRKKLHFCNIFIFVTKVAFYS